ncbi:MAG TPA: energy transducer TonB [Candidatus Obscuribacterales bacterium]
MDGAGIRIKETLSPSERIALINIAPYRNEVLRRIRGNWNPGRTSGTVVVLLTVAQDGTLVSADILQRSGKKKFDRQALEAIRSTEFPPLPEAYKGSDLQFRITLTSVVETSSEE